MYDAIVIGAGPAGLQAALTLGRMHRSALLLDSGEYRNGTVRHMHNMIGADGLPPAELRARARSELAAYDGVEVREATAVRIDGAIDAFEVRLDDGSTAAARRVVLATGMADALPDVEGLQELWGVRAFNCPFCDGHEHAGKDIAIIGDPAQAAHQIGLLGRIVRSITVFPVGPVGPVAPIVPVAPIDVSAAEALGVRVSNAPATRVAETEHGVVVTTTDGETTVGGIFVAAVTSRQRAPFAAQLGLALLPSGAIEIDDLGATSVPGVSAAGDIAHRASLPGAMATVLLAASAGQLAAIGIIRSLAAAEVAAMPA